jgi:outer membrane biosynthesis protein TonB
MASRWLQQRLVGPGRRLGLALALSSAAHLGCLALLLNLATRGAGTAPDGDTAEGDRVEVTTAGDPGPLPGLAPADSAPAPPKLARKASASAVPARPRPGAGIRVAGAHSSTKTASTTPGAVESDAPVLGRQAASARASSLAALRTELKQRLRAAWRARAVYERIDPQGRLQGTLLVTKLNVRLRADGSVEKTALHDSSGIPALDTEATAAVGRMKPLSPLGPDLVDAQGGFLVRCAFHLDLGLIHFANQLHQAIAGEWRPGRAFMSSGDRERVTVIRLELSRQGRLLQAALEQSAGIDFLDRNALGWARTGMPLPAPPANFMRGAERVPIWVAFAHLSGRFVVRDPEEDLDAE